MKEGLRRQFMLFSVVGILGFTIDATLFYMLTSRYLWSVPSARTLSASCSIAATWVCNRMWTFAARKSRNAAAELLRYAVVQLGGLLVNIGVFVACLALIPALRSTPIIALAIGAAVALLFNFISARAAAFRAPSRSR
jgi:putative flippase GtrA